LSTGSENHSDDTRLIRWVSTIPDGAADRIRAEMFRRIGLEELLSPRIVD
jgi:hypothetical protein